MLSLSATRSSSLSLAPHVRASRSRRPRAPSPQALNISDTAHLTSARRRKRMELASTTTINSSSTRCGGGEMRRIHIMHFLSRMGLMEEPHLIRLHHHNRNGVFLRVLRENKDVKRWLGDLRGKKMLETFAWSYMRRYKTDYVWQDLLDDDFITPISDNEYVLKGSQIFIPSTTAPFDGSNAQDEKKGSLTQDSLKHEVGEIHGDDEQQSNKIGTIPSSSSFYSNLLGKKMNINIEKIGANNSSSTSTSSSCSSQSSFSRSKSNSNGTSKMLQNLLSTCGAVNTNDATLVPLKKSAPNSRTHVVELRSRERLGGSARTFRTSWNQQHRQQQPRSARSRRNFDGLHQKQEQEQKQKRSRSSRMVSK